MENISPRLRGAAQLAGLDDAVSDRLLRDRIATRPPSRGVSPTDPDP